MDMLDFAMAIETEGIDFYTDLAARTPLRQIAGIFEFFAREERRHYDIFSAWKRNVKAPAVEDTNLVRKTVEVFREISRNFVTAGTPAIDHEDAYKKALSLEEKSIAFYNDAEARTANEEQKTVLKLIIHQEHTHVRLINQMMEFQRHPNEWLENAEWNHQDEY